MFSRLNFFRSTSYNYGRTSLSSYCGNQKMPYKWFSEWKSKLFHICIHVYKWTQISAYMFLNEFKQECLEYAPVIVRFLYFYFLPRTKEVHVNYLFIAWSSGTKSGLWGRNPSSSPDSSLICGLDKPVHLSGS